ncbi:MAG TPA: squalene/phytoene synthase family protein [Stellaceae bacterium]|nr:squalene/phytoene synthase family protein [Stellaceae bacterium]
MTNALSPVGALVRRHDRDRFLTAQFAPRARREALYALYAFNYEVAKTREMVRETVLGHMRLQWWRETIAAIYAGAPSRLHAVAAPLAETIAAHHLSREYFDRLIDSREADLDDRPPRDLAALEAYAAATSGGLVALALEALGVRTGPAHAAGTEIGVAHALAGLLLAVPFHARARRLYLPADLIAAHGINVERTVFALKSAPALDVVAAFIAARARAHLAVARARRSDVPPAAVPALLPAVLAARGLDRLARAGGNPFAPRLTRPDGGKIAALALAALRGRY